MTTKESRIAALERTTGLKETEDEAMERAVREMPDEELEVRAREILANKDPPAEDDLSPEAVLERKARKLLARRDAERARQ